MPTKKKTTRKRPKKAEVQAAKKTKRGRPRVVIPWEQVNEMGKIHCTVEEVAAILGVNQDTLSRVCIRDNGVKIVEYLEKMRAFGRKSLRRRQYETAMSEEMKGSATMQIWLGKQWLGQADKAETKTETTGAQIVTVKIPDNGRG